jgi:hypothetical protein
MLVYTVVHQYYGSPGDLDNLRTIVARYFPLKLLLFCDMRYSVYALRYFSLESSEFFYVTHSTDIPLGGRDSVVIRSPFILRMTEEQLYMN